MFSRTSFLVVLTMICESAGCIESPLVPCDDIVCPPGNVCTTGGCATPADVAACDGLTDGAACRAANGGAGTCQGGACQTGLCGNGVLDVFEICDDGNQVSGDGCRDDCAKVERCDDGQLDDGEACDDGNLNAADGCDQCVITMWNARAVVGAPGSAVGTALANPAGVAVDGLGRVYLADSDNHRIRRVELDGSITTIAGIGTIGFSGDGGPATSAQLAQPATIALDGVGRVFISDTGNHRIRRVEIDGTITTIAGTGVAGSAGDGGAAILAQLSRPYGIAVDGFGRVFIADAGNHRIRRIEIDSTITVVAGTGTAGFSGDGAEAVDAELASPYGIALDSVGRLVIADTGNHRLRRVDLDGTISTVGGTGGSGFSGDGGLAIAAQLASPVGIAVDGLGRIVVADTLNHRIRRIEATGTITTVAGTGSFGFGGDGGQGTAARVAAPFGVGADAQGRITIADTFNQRIRRLELDGTIATVAGTGTFGFGGDGREATSAQLASPQGVAVDAQSRIYIADSFNHRIRRVELDGTITTVAGTGIPGFAGDGGLATRAQLEHPNAVVLDPQGRILIADTFNQRIRIVDLDGTIRTIAGTGIAGFDGDGRLATSSRINNPNSLAIDAQGRLVIADTYNNRVRRIELDGTFTTLAGNGLYGFGGDGAPATTATLTYPAGVALDLQGRLLMTDTANHRVRRVELDGTMTTIAGNGTVGSVGDGGPAVDARLDSPKGITIDLQGRVVFADSYNHLVRRIELDGTITRIAGSGAPGASGDGGPAVVAELRYLVGVAVDPLGRIVIADINNQRIRRVEDGTITTVAGKIDPENVGLVGVARLEDPQAIVVTPALTLVAGGTSGTLEAIRSGRVEVVAGRYPEENPTGALARFRTEGFGSVGGVALDSTTGLIYVTETSANRLHVITQVDPANPRTWTIATLVNASATPGSADGPAATARLRQPTGLFLDDTTRTLYIADSGNHGIRALDLVSNTVTTIANTSRSLGFAGDDGLATAALLYQPTAITRCANGDLFIADTGNNRVRRIINHTGNGTGVITTVLGDGVPASSGEGSPARTFPVDGPRGLACDAYGNLFVTSSTTVRLLTTANLGVIDGTGAVQTIYGAPPRTTFPSSVTSCLTGIAVTGDTTVQIADACTGLLVQLERAPAL